MLLGKRFAWRRVIIELTVLLVMVCMIALGLICQMNEVDVVHYYVGDCPGTIVLITDVHNSSLDITSAVIEQHPDLILVAGDMVDADEENTYRSQELLRGLSEIAPTFISYGNQELEYIKIWNVNLNEVFSETGVMLLDREYVDVELGGGAPVRIGGIYGYCLPERYSGNNTDEISFLREFEKTENYKILLDHLPYSWSHYGITDDYDIDLVLSGHTHGGQVIIPFMGGLYEQEFGWFPGRMHGRFESNDTTVIVSRGVSSAKERIPRINNPAEICVIEALTKQ